MSNETEAVPNAKQLKAKWLLMLGLYLDRYIDALDTAFLHPVAVHATIIVLIKKRIIALQARIERAMYFSEKQVELPFKSAMDFEYSLINNRGKSNYWWGDGLRAEIAKSAHEIEELAYQQYFELGAVVPDIDVEDILPRSLPKLPEISRLILIAEVILRTGGDGRHMATTTATGFEPEKSILVVAGSPVKIRKFSDQYHLLRIIFENEARLKDEWFFSEIAERYDDSGTINEDKKFYNAAYQVKQKITKDTGIKDFFVLTKQSLKISEKYLSQS